MSANDRCIPLLVWWAVENQATVVRDSVLLAFASPSAWSVALIRDTIVGRLLKRYAAEGTPAGFRSAARIFASARTAVEAQNCSRSSTKVWS